MDPTVDSSTAIIDQLDSSQSEELQNKQTSAVEHKQTVDGNDKKLRENESNGLELRSTTTSSLPGVLESNVVADQNQQLAQPGAIAVRGFDRTNSRSSSEDDDDFHEINPPANPSEVVIPENEVRALTVERDPVRESKIAAQVRDAVLQDAVQAEILAENSVTTGSDEIEKSQDSGRSSAFRKRIYFAVFVAVILIVAIVLLAVLIPRRSSHGPKQNVTTETPDDPSCMFCIKSTVNDFPTNSSFNLTAMLAAAPNHTIFLDILKREAIDSYLNNVTIFAPPDEAFNKLEAPFSYYVTTFLWIYHLVTLIVSHVTAKPWTSTEIFENGEVFENFFGRNVTVNQTDKTIANGAKILIADIVAANGYIQIPDRVFLVDELRVGMFDRIKMLSDDLGFGTLVKLIEFANLQDVLAQTLPRGLMFFAPTDYAFEALGDEYVKSLTQPGNENSTRELLLYHIVRYNWYEGLLLSFNYVQNRTEIGDISSTDLSLWVSSNATADSGYVNNVDIYDEYYASNGLISRINQTLLPPAIDDLMIITTNSTIAFKFKTFLSIINGPAKLDSLFGGEGPLTLFAPLDQAFESNSSQLKLWLDGGWLLHLQSFVKHHAVEERIRGADLAEKNTTVTMLSGFSETIQGQTNGTSSSNELSWSSLTGGKYSTASGITFESGPTVTLKNLYGTNGILFGIDGLLMPSWVDIDINRALVEMSEFATLLALAELINVTDNVLVGSGPFTLLAPNNTAFSALELGADVNVTLIGEILARHIFVGNLYVSALNKTVKSLNNETYQVRKDGNQTFVGGALLLETDILCKNGVVHVIDRVLGN